MNKQSISPEASIMILLGIAIPCAGLTMWALQGSIVAAGLLVWTVCSIVSHLSESA